MTHRLAVYGSLAPGKSNHDQLDGLAGTWTPATVRGWVATKDYGLDIGYPALTLDPSGPVVELLVFCSDDLARHWNRLDEFEGDGYQRVSVLVRTAEGEVTAWVYVEK